MTSGLGSSLPINPGPSLAQHVRVIPGIGEKRAELLSQIGIVTLNDLLFRFPRDYVDRTRIVPIAELQEGQTATVEAEVVASRAVRLRRRLTLAETTLQDASGRIKAIWFGRGYLAQTFRPGVRALFTGPVGKRKGLVLNNPEYEILSGDDEDTRLNTGRIVPIYRLTEGLSQRILRRAVAAALENVPDNLPETLPNAVRERYGFPAVNSALRNVHFPDSDQDAQIARGRFAFEELLAIQLGILSGRAARLRLERGIRHVTAGPLLARFRASLPFSLTRSQEQAVRDLLADMASPRPAMRLLHGDVGCGKTVVALHGVVAAADGGYQTALMAPTEILAEQHGITLRHLLKPLGLRVELITGGAPDVAAARARTARGDSHVVVGTHALIQDETQFSRLGLVIVDEQHRFGVLQRSALAAKGYNPDILHMTATPIPRTLVLTVYGGMDITAIDEMPPGRLPVRTRRVTPAQLPIVHRHICEQAEKGYQTYYVCPLIEESDSRDAAAATRHYEELSRGPFASLQTGLIHGRMPAKEKDDIMHRFRRGEIDVLFSTSVIEVGVDCPHATTMVIEDAAQFGLSQLHQLRGRVGRGGQQAHCFLLGRPRTQEGEERLQIMCRTTDGFEIAEADLKLRGPGEFLGVRQAGLSDLQAADLIRDARLLDAAQREAQTIIEHDPLGTDPALAYLWKRAARFREFTA